MFMPDSSSFLLRRIVFSTFLLLVLIGNACAEEWTIPLGGNAFPTDPDKGRGVGRRGTVSLRDSKDRFCVFFRADRAAQLQLSVSGTTKSDSSIVVEVGGSRIQTSVNSLDSHTHSLSVAAEAGYVRVDLSGTDNMPSPVDLTHLVVSSDTAGLKLDYVATNEGNMFYWGRRGPSVHLRYRVPRGQKLTHAYSEITVPEGQDPIGSYFMANGFGEGYFGFQVNSASERRVLFSVWSPYQTDNPQDIPVGQRITELGHGEGVHVGKFGNEGSGGQSYLVYPWQAGRTYRFLTEVRPDGQGQTVYTSWFGDKAAGEWKLIASFRRPKTNTHLRGFHSFLESFSPNYGHLGRRALYGNVWVRDTNEEWHECTNATLSVDGTGRGRHRLDFSGGVDGKQFFMRNCGFFNDTVFPGKAFTRDSTATDRPKIDLAKLPQSQYAAAASQDKSNGPKVSSGGSLRVLTYNIHHGRAMDGKFDYERLAKTIARLKPDVVALQEVDNKTTRSSGVNQAKELGERLKMNFVFGNALNYAGGQYGEAVLSRFPIKNSIAHSLPYNKGNEPRTALAAHIVPGNGLPEFLFIGTHLCHQSTETRLEQTKELRKLFSKDSELPVILAGDMNARPASGPMRELLENEWIDAVAPKSRIDYILLRKQDHWSIQETIIVDEPVVSDHDPVLTILKWNPKTK